MSATKGNTDPWDGRLVAGARPLEGYRLTRFLGGGGFGEVWEAEVSPAGVFQALKFVKTEPAESVMNLELKALEIYKKGIRHVNLVNLINYWSDQCGYLIIAMDLGEKTLEDVFQEEKRNDREGIPIERLLGYMADAAEGIDYLNAPTHFVNGEGPFGIHHRDIKPSNLLIFGGSVKVADISLLKLMPENISDHSSGICTHAYAAPEFLLEEKERKTIWSSDQYSLAATYCYLRCGRPPYGFNPVQIVLKQHMQEPPDLSGLFEAERQVLSKALNLDPEARYRMGCKEFVEALRVRLRPSAPEFVPEFVFFYANKGDEAYNGDDDAKALNYYSQVVQQDPSNEKYRIQLGNTHANLGDYAAAARVFGEEFDDPVFKKLAQEKLDRVQTELERSKQETDRAKQKQVWMDEKT
jgi:serine/threonine protein kinase